MKEYVDTLLNDIEEIELIQQHIWIEKMIDQAAWDLGESDTRGAFKEIAAAIKAAPEELFKEALDRNTFDALIAIPRKIRDGKTPKKEEMKEWLGCVKTLLERSPEHGPMVFSQATQNMIAIEEADEAAFEDGIPAAYGYSFAAAHEAAKATENTNAPMKHLLNHLIPGAVVMKGHLSELSRYVYTDDELYARQINNLETFDPAKNPPDKGERIIDAMMDVFKAAPDNPAAEKMLGALVDYGFKQPQDIGSVFMGIETMLEHRPDLSTNPCLDTYLEKTKVSCDPETMRGALHMHILETRAAQLSSAERPTVKKPDAGAGAAKLEV